MGIDLDKIAGSLEDAAVFAQGSSESSLGGALVLTSSSDEAAKTVANLGTLLRNTQTPGRDRGEQRWRQRLLGPRRGARPQAAGRRRQGRSVAIGYGLAAALQGLNPGSGATLSDNPNYKAAVSALGSTPISAFVDGPQALRLAEVAGVALGNRIPGRPSPT